MEPLPFLIEKNGILELNEKLLEIIKQSYNPRLLLIYGKARQGKSTTLNQLIRGSKNTWTYKNSSPFESKTRQESVTIGCYLYGPIKISEIINRHNLKCKIKDDFDVLFCDTEGLHSINGQSKELIPGILTLLQICTFSIIMINSVPSVDDLSQLSADIQFSKIFKQINKDLQSPLVGIYISGYQIDISEYDNFELCKDEYNTQSNNTLESIIEKINEDYPNLELEKKDLKIIAGGPYDNYLNKEPDKDDLRAQLYWSSINDIIMKFYIHCSKNRGYNADKFVSLIKIVFDIFINFKSLPKNFDLKTALIEYVNSSFTNYFNKQIDIINEEITKDFDKNILEYYKILIDDNDAEMKLKICINQDMIDIYKNLIPEKINNFMINAKNELRISINNQFVNKFENKKKEILDENYINHYLNDINNEIEKARFQEDINSDIINKYKNIWNLIEKENKNLFIYFQNYDKEKIKLLHNDLNNLIEKHIKNLLSLKKSWKIFLEEQKKIIKKEIKLKYLELFKSIKYQEDINELAKKKDKISEEIFNELNEFKNLENIRKEEIINWIQNSCESEYENLIKDINVKQKFESITNDIKMRINDLINDYVDKIFNGKNFKEEIDINLENINIKLNQMIKELIDSYDITEENKNKIINLINQEVNKTVILIVQKREELPSFNEVLLDKKNLCEKILNQKIEELISKFYYIEDKIKFNENDFINILKQNEDICSNISLKDERFKNMITEISQRKFYDYEKLTQQLPKWEKIKENIRQKIQSICDEFIKKAIENKYYKEDIEFDVNELLSKIDSLKLFDDIKSNKHDEIKDLINTMIKESNNRVITEQNKLSKWSDIKDILIESGYNIMIEKSNNNLKTKDLNKIVNILINEIYNYPDFLDICKNDERKKEIINALITKAEIIGKKYIENKINEEKKELENENRFKEVELKYENEKKEKIQAQNLAEEIKINAERAILNMKNEISKTQALPKENKTHSNVSIEYYPIPDYKGYSFVDALVKINVIFSYEFREKIAIANNIKDYIGSSEQNLHLLGLLMSGKLIKPKN